MWSYYRLKWCQSDVKKVPNIVGMDRKTRKGKKLKLLRCSHVLGTSSPLNWAVELLLMSNCSSMPCDLCSGCSITTHPSPSPNFSLFCPFQQTSTDFVNYIHGRMLRSLAQSFREREKQQPAWKKEAWRYCEHNSGGRSRLSTWMHLSGVRGRIRVNNVRHAQPCSLPPWIFMKEREEKEARKVLRYTGVSSLRY